MDQTTYGLASRALPVRRQLQIVTLIALGAAGILFVGWGASKLSAAQPTPPLASATTAENSLHLTDSQLHSLTVSPVARLGFRTEEIADGQIALNSDTATQVFSPYSGR